MSVSWVHTCAARRHKGITRNEELRQSYDLGEAKNVVVEKEIIFVIDGTGKASDINARIESIRQRAEEATSDYDKEKLQERVAQLSDGLSTRQYIAR